MNRAEFIAQSKQGQRRNLIWSSAFLAALAIFGLAGHGVVALLDFTKPTAVKFGILAVFLVFAIIVLISVVRISVRVQIRCRQCRKEFGPISTQIVIASGRCGFCGTRLLEDAGAEP